MADKSGRTQLSPTTPEFGYLEYGLQLTLKASTARIIAAYAISNPHLTIQFDKRCKDILSLTSWTDVSQLTGANTEEEVIRRGFQFKPSAGVGAGQPLPAAISQPQSGPGSVGSPVQGGVGGGNGGSGGLLGGGGGTSGGMSFVVGSSLRTLRSRETKVGQGSNAGGPSVVPHQPHKTVHKALVCKIGVGRSYVCDDALGAEREPLPEGYDSFYLRDQSLVDEKTEEYFHTYYVKNSAQILPQYLVHYEFDPVKEMQSRERAKCDNCEQAEATVHCAADAAHLCNKCDSLLHSSKLASRHVRTPVGKGADVFGFCRHHPEKLVEFFCSQCHIPVCVYCKMVGNHANGDSAKHQLVSVGEAYQSVLQEAQTHDPILQTRRTEVNNQVAAIHARAKAVEKMASGVEAQIEEMYKRALAELKHITNTKLDILLGDELELKRQLGEIDRLEYFMRYIQSGDATLFLFSWARHQHFRSELHDFRFFRDEIDVQLDVKVTGGVSVVQDPGPGYPAASPTRTTNAGEIQYNSSQTAGLMSPTGPPSGGLAGMGMIGGGGLGMMAKTGYSKHIGAGPGSPARESTPQAGMAGHHHRPPPTAGMYAPQYSPEANQQPNYPAGVGMGFPQKLQQQRRVQRRASDFFSEALGAFDTLSIHQGNEDEGAE